MIERNRIQIVDSTLREGQQGVDPLRHDRGIVFSRDQQIKIAELLTNFGVDYVEVGAPVKSPFGVETIRQIVDVAHQSNTQVLVHARCTEEDIDAFFETGADGIELYIGASEANRNGNNGRSLDKTIQLAQSAISLIRAQEPDTFIRFSPEDAFRTPYEDLIKIINAVKDGVNRIGLPDTTGVANYRNVYRVTRKVKRAVGDKELQFHSHNDDGLVNARYLEAARGGVQVFDTSILGIGERNGIISLGGFMASMHTHGYAEQIEEKYNLEQLPLLNSSVAQMLDITVSHSEPLNPNSGKHSAGVHGAAVLRDPRSYQAIDYGKFGVASGQLLYASAVVGAANITARATELGYGLLPNVAKDIAAQVRELAKSQGSISPGEVDQLIVASTGVNSSLNGFH